MDLNMPLRSLGPVFRMKAKALSKIGIETVEDFLFYTPLRYESNLIVSKIAETQVGETVTIQGEVTATSNVFTRRRLTIQRITIDDGTGKIDCVFFNQRFILNNIKKSDFLSAAGRVEKFGNKRTLATRHYEVLKSKEADAIHTTGLVPIYSEAGGVSSKWIRGRIKTILDLNVKIDDFIPEEIVKKNSFLNLHEAIYKIHFPKSAQEAEVARQRLSFDELFLKHAASKLRKKDWESQQKAIPFETEKHSAKIRELIKSLPFKLTTGQIKATEDILKDLSRDVPMNRLLEGDVGSGKTVVAAIAVYSAYLNGFESAFMAPTEILANQHFATISDILEPLGVKVRLFTSSNKKQRATSDERNFDVVIGTHALVQKKVNFERLGLVVIDEQQRFGVEQRANLREKGQNPHLLTMTATPIPRTIFLTIYADLALSLLDELPKGRKKIKTWLVPENKREGAYKWIEEKIRMEKSQVFIVCPFIEPSETLTTVKAVKDEFERLAKNVFPKFKLGLLHGKMKGSEKDNAIKEFRNGKIDILVATPVIEVGIDIPSADIILIEGSERFGLAQLHQLRGRVGRGEKESFCLLFTTSNTDKTHERLSYLRTIDNGAELAEVDLKLRGPGEMFGTMQHGIPDLKIATLSDFPLMKLASEEAERILPHLDRFPELKVRIIKTNVPKISKD